MKSSFIIFITIQFFAINIINSQVGIVDQNAENKPTIVFVGTYHMGNQGNNVYKGNYDDILLPERQQELQVLLRKLKDFKPTKIVIERDVSDSSKVLGRYQEYLKGNYKLTRNEVHQIGFRLANELNHDKIYSVDWGIFPKDSLYWYETFAKSDPKLNSYLSQLRQEGSKNFEKKNQALNKLPLIDQIRTLNQKENIENDHKAYFNIMRIGLGDKYVGANYLSWWYGRNMKILVNIIRLTESAKDRILVIYGYGHSKLLTQLTIESQFYNVIDPIEILKD
ncbi:MAG: DUF5694 domain-containing protein [Saonia sp.]